MKNTIIYFVRHGNFNNPKKIAGGNPRANLNKEGIKQIRKVGEFLSKEKIVVIYSSPFIRTIESAKILVGYFNKIKIINDNELAEWKSEIHGKKKALLEKNNLLNIYLETPTKLKGESLNRAAERMKAFCIRLVKSDKGKKFICVSHKDNIRALRLLLQGKSLNGIHKIKCEKGSITRLVFNDNLKLQGLKYINLK